MPHVMLDLETYGTEPGCGIISIGAVAFNLETGELGRDFYTVVNRESGKKYGLTDNPQTLKWWGQQSAEARKVLDEACDPSRSIPLDMALKGFAEFLRQVCAPIQPDKMVFRDLNLWGNGSDFDNMVLAAAYDKTKIQRPWRYTSNRCFRTLRNLCPTEVEWERIGVYHNALDDAKTQAVHAAKLLKALKGEK